MSRLQKLLGVGKGYLERLPPVDVHKLLRIVLMNLPYIVIFYVGNKLAWLYQYCVGDSMIERLMVLVLNFQMAFSRILPSMHKNELLVGITGAVAVKLGGWHRAEHDPARPRGRCRHGGCGRRGDGRPVAVGGQSRRAEHAERLEKRSML